MSAQFPTSPGDPLIVGTGARTASGLTALQVTMSARALHFSPRPSHLVSRTGDEIATARLASIADNVIGIDRFVALGAPSLAQAAFPWLSSRRAQGTPLLPVFVALPSVARPGVDPRLDQHLLDALEARSRVPLDHGRSRLVRACRGGGVMAFEAALAELRRDGCEAVAVGGIDTYFDPDILEHLDRELRLHGPGVENGFVPGEGSAFVVLVERRRAGGLERAGRVVSVASAREPRPYGSDDPCVGLGITTALRRALEGASLAESRSISWILTDVANERHRVDEWSYGAARAHLAFAKDAVHDQPLLRTGDLGAASAAVLSVMAATRWQTGAALGDRTLIAVHSDGPERGVMILAREGVA
jgi:3-oxoacyl-[acyl-carrier-protein] synthase-1